MSATATRQRSVLLLVCLTQFMIVLDASVVNVALPAIQLDLGFSRTALPWVPTAYTLLFGGLLLVGGRATDLIGGRRTFTLGLALFTAASAADGLASSPTALIIARLVQGAGAAFAAPAGLTILVSTFVDEGGRTRALAAYGAVGAGGATFGIVLGGLLTDLLSWEWIFFVNVPIGLLVLVMALRALPGREQRHGPTDFDAAGAALATSGLMLLVLAINQASSWDWLDARTICCLIAGASLLVGFIRLQERKASPLLDLAIFRFTSLRTANAAALLVTAAAFAAFYLSCLYLQQVRGASALEAGLSILPTTFATALSAAFSQRLVPRFGMVGVLCGALVLMAAGLSLMATNDATTDFLTGVAPGYVILGLGMGAAFTLVAVMATAGVEPAKQGQASGIFNTSQQIGGTLGVAVLATLANQVTGTASPAARGAISDGLSAAFFGAAAIAVIAIPIVIATARRHGVVSSSRDAPGPAEQVAGQT